MAAPDSSSPPGKASWDLGVLCKPSISSIRFPLLAGSKRCSLAPVLPNPPYPQRACCLTLRNLAQRALAYGGAG